MRVMQRWSTIGLALVLAVAIGACGSDDDGGDGNGTADAMAPGGADASVPAGATVTTYTLTRINLEDPGAAAGILGNLIQTAINKLELIVLIQLDGWDGDGAVSVYGGAGQLSVGADTLSDPVDDVYAWLTQGECLDATGGSHACTVDVGEVAAMQTGDSFASMGTGFLNIYSAELQLIIPLKGLTLSGTVFAPDMAGDLEGFVTEEDAKVTVFELSPGNSLDLDAFLRSVMVMPTHMVDDGTGNMVPGYRFAGEIEGTSITFAE